MATTPDRTFESPTIGSGLQPAFTGVAGPGPGVYRLRAIVTNPLCERWVEWVGDDRLEDFGKDDLEIHSPLLTRNGAIWPDPRAGSMCAGVAEPWSPTHHNTMVGWWRPPFRRLDKKRGAPIEVLAWCRYSYPAYLLNKLARRRPTLETLQAGYAVDLYRAASRLSALTVRDLERAITLRPCLGLAKKIRPSILLRPAQLSKLRLELQKLEHVKVQPGCLSNWAATAVGLGAEVPKSKLARLLSPLGPEDLLLKLKGSLVGSDCSFFFVRQESDEALRLLYSLWEKTTSLQRQKWDRDLTPVARAIRAASIVDSAGLAMVRAVVQTGPSTGGVVQHFRSMLNILEGGVASVRAQLI